jgi:hypothetical protein
MRIAAVLFLMVLCLGWSVPLATEETPPPPATGTPALDTVSTAVFEVAYNEDRNFSDQFTFDAAEMTSTRYAEQGYKPAKYTEKKDGSRIQVEAKATDEAGNALVWSGVVFRLVEVGKKPLILFEGVLKFTAKNGTKRAVPFIGKYKPPRGKR